MMEKRGQRLLKRYDEGAQTDSEWKHYMDGKYVKPEMTPEIYRYLVDTFREDVLELQDMLKLDLSSWLSYRDENN
jgi:hypothetical protein